jgi:hypothetical protein
MANYNYNLLFYFDSKVKYRLDLLTDFLIAGLQLKLFEAWLVAVAFTVVEERERERVLLFVKRKKGKDEEVKRWCLHGVST